MCPCTRDRRVPHALFRVTHPWPMQVIEVCYRFDSGASSSRGLSRQLGVRDLAQPERSVDLFNASCPNFLMAAGLLEG